MALIFCDAIGPVPLPTSLQSAFYKNSSSSHGGVAGFIVSAVAHDTEVRVYNPARIAISIVAADAHNPAWVGRDLHNRLLAHSAFAPPQPFSDYGIFSILDSLTQDGKSDRLTPQLLTDRVYLRVEEFP